MLLLSLTGCGNKVDSESIRSYLESSYYNESDASVDEIKDISQEQGNNDKEFIVSCTVKASNRYAVQTANWVITFERFENSWVGTGREMTYYETELQNGMSEEEMKDLVALEGLYWQKEFESWLTYDVSDWYCTADLENGECEVSYLLTTDYGGFQFFRVYRTTAISTHAPLAGRDSKSVQITMHIFAITDKFQMLLHRMPPVRAFCSFLMQENHADFGCEPPK